MMEWDSLLGFNNWGEVFVYCVCLYTLVSVRWCWDRLFNGGGGDFGSVGVFVLYETHYWPPSHS